MALTVKSTEQFQNYFKGVAGRADHHAPGVSEIIYPLIGLIILYLDPSSDIEVREYNGSPTNMLWVHINGKRYAFRYDHQNDNIESREGGVKRNVLHTVSNSNTIADLATIFQELTE